MDPAVAVLSVGITVLACGSLSLLILQRYSRSLRGIGWLSGAFAAGTLSAALLLARGWPVLSILCADLALLLSFFLLELAVARLLREPPPAVWLSAVLAGLQVTIDLLCRMELTAPKLRIISLGVCVAIQTATTATVLFRAARQQLRAAATFSAVVLAMFAGFNLGRSTVELFSYHQALHPQLKMVAFALYLCVGLGLAFGFLWMTTAMLAGELEHMASTDPLTRLFNRRVFLQWCEKELERSRRIRTPFSMLMVDLDHFKRINDDFGHHIGDQVLCAAVEQMQDSVRGIDVLCRWGGEEFAVLLPNAPLESTRLVAERIRENIQKVILPLHTLSPDTIVDFRLTASIGTATFREPGDSVACLLQRADEALYQAKRAGRNRVLEAV